MVVTRGKAASSKMADFFAAPHDDEAQLSVLEKRGKRKRKKKADDGKDAEGEEFGEEKRQRGRNDSALLLPDKARRTEVDGNDRSTETEAENQDFQICEGFLLVIGK